MKTLRAICPFAAALALVCCARRVEQPASGSQAAIMPAKQTQNAVFDHRQPDHAKVACVSCHARSLDNPAAAGPQFPPHSACMDCHSRENYLTASPSAPLCATCHPASQTLDASLKTRLLPFPKELHQFSVAAFSHRDHGDEAKMSPSPSAYGCAFCHTGGAGLVAKAFPAHAECYACHIHQAGGKLARCQDCHAPVGESLAFTHGEGVAGRDYNFLHSGHEKRKDGSAIPCSACHGLTAEKARVSDISRMEPVRGELHRSSCWGTCHIQKEETSCGRCHVRGVPRVVIAAASAG